MVTGTTRNSGQASIMATSTPPASSARYSVWPGWRKPASCRVFFWMGLVTMPATSPASASLAARSMASRVAGALTGSGWPARTGAPQPHRQHRQRRLEGLAGLGRPVDLAHRNIRGQACRRGRPAGRRRRGRRTADRRVGASTSALRLSSPPMPAGSPIVTASGAADRHGCLMSTVAWRRRSRM